MLRTSPVLTLIPLCLLAYAGLAGAQQPSQSAPVSSAPPKLERVEEGSDAPVTITPKRGEKKITEKREGGRVTEVKVQTGGSTYYMKPNVPAGNAQPGDAQSSAIRAPQWQILEFDLNAKKKKQAEAAAAAEVPPPPPPPAK